MSDQKPAPSALTGGTLDRTPVTDLFRNLYVERATAQVLIAYRSEERNFWFDRGQLISASSNREAQQVGELLRTFGLADDSVLFAAFERALAEPGRGLAKALGETGAVPGYVADACVRALAERILFDTFQWSAGAYTITPLEKAPEPPVRFDRSNASLILEGLRRLPSDAPPPGPQPDPRSRPMLSQDILLRYQSITVTPDEADVIAKSDGTRLASEVCVDLRILSRLAAIGLIQLVPPGKTAEKKIAPEGLTNLNVEISGTPPPPRAAEMLESQANLIRNTYRRIDWVTLYEVLGVARNAPLEEVQRSVHERARVFHPDHHLRPTLGPLRDALESLFRKLRQAETTFKSDDRRSSYDTQTANGAGQVVTMQAGPTPEVQLQVARANYMRARTLFEQEDYYPAYEMVRQSVEFDPERPEYWVLLSRIQRKNPKWVRQSAETMRRATARLPENVEVWFELSEACAAERNETERVKALREVLKLDPGNRRAQSALAEIASMKPGR